ncbi:MAG: HAD family phosphatase [Clostridia bacterium]|nr:HAD family phosphatase [Clostridia bacterium]
MIKGAIFDMDGTLLDSMAVWHRLSQGFVEPYGVQITREDYEAVEGGTQLGVAQYFVARYPEIPMTAEEMVERMNVLINERYETLAKPKDGVLAFLDALRAQGVACAIATLTDRAHAEKALRDRDMLHYFDCMLTIQDIGGSKREPEIYLKAAAHMGCEADECMVFEDAPYAAQTAKNAGFAVCGVIEKAYAAGEPLLRQVSDLIVERSFDEIHTAIFG